MFIILSRVLLLLMGCGILINPVGADGEKVRVIFRNELSVEIELCWDGEEKRIPQYRIPGNGGEIMVHTLPGHRFSYEFGTHRHIHTIPAGAVDLVEPLVIVLLGGNNEIAVKCTTTVNGYEHAGKELNIRVIPWWSPRGATRFLDLVRKGYYNGTALNRVVPNFLTQFGISADYKLRTEFMKQRILDDPKHDPPIKFSPGTMSFAGSGPNSRTTEIFTVMPGTPQGQLDYFGRNPWETPFGHIDNVAETPVDQWYSYGDMPPYGSGPSSQKIYEENGYDYLKENFPKMDYIEKCHVVEIEPEVANEL